MKQMDVLVVDDEAPARDELAWLLERDPRIGTVRSAGSAAEALRVLQEGSVDAVFLDIHMPGLSGLDLAQVLSNFKEPPPVVFVTAHDEHAVDAFDLRAVDYVLKPVREDRLAEAVRRLVAGQAPPAREADDQIPVERGGVTRFIRRRDVRYVEAQGDYARLHTATDSHLVRTPLTTLAEQWAPAGFVRIHRSLLVNLAHVREVRMDEGRCTVVVGDVPLQVSRRHTRELREVLTRRTPRSTP
ncbi:LytR/AlgR family response regulator transcription factor [Nocardioides jiangxiensis]|uniref:LytTR family DNA-binding domain-containing protein n=1 Tax=Nocardioides jiangxiensis TaxID=3064524 RepID=A0ABT9B0S6_9ACTN|nr:LytTR family DNA-binding domain-containing protein [Nocardioides sp. WY-20]MDO7868461.1 LytTR family DNA-binding domain-containing protein [Nocardioides sp. WY-20]